jgi:hypothetical protein
MDKLRISDNGRYFVKADGTPFIWLADTAWTVPAKLKWDDVQHFMKTRREQGFTVLQMVVLDPEYNEDMRNPCGIPALNNGNILDPNQAYFSYVDWVLDQAETYGFYVLLLPVWGELVVGWDWSGNDHPVYVNEENAFAYGSWLGARMRHRSNIVGCLGGDRMPIHKGVDYRKVWRSMAEGLAKGLTGRDLKYNKDHEAWKKLMITYHACHEAETGLCSTFSSWTDEEAWISFIMLQSGHGVSVKNYELVRQEYQRANVMPVWDGEPAYEMMPTTWPIKDLNSFHSTRSVRTRAYCSLFAGAFGYTYGHASVWCMISEKERNDISKYTWYEALHSDGSQQIKVLRDFLDSFAIQDCVPCQEVLLRQASEQDVLELHEQACYDEGRKRMFVYFSGRTAEEIDVAALGSNQVYALWFNPSDGTVGTVFSPVTKQGRVFIENNDAEAEDRILILSDNPEKLVFHSRNYGEDEKIQAAQKVFEW